MKNTNKTVFFLFTLVLTVACQPNPYGQGKTLYQNHCENCHMEDGSGLSKLIPSLEKSALFDSKPEALVCLLRNGLEKNPETGQEMPGNILLNDVEMTNLVNYLRSIYAADPVPVKVSEVNEWLESCP